MNLISLHNDIINMAILTEVYMFTNDNTPNIDQLNTDLEALIKLLNDLINDTDSDDLNNNHSLELSMIKTLIKDVNSDFEKIKNSSNPQDQKLAHSEIFDQLERAFNTKSDSLPSLIQAAAEPTDSELATVLAHMNLTHSTSDLIEKIDTFIYPDMN